MANYLLEVRSYTSLYTFLIFTLIYILWCFPSLLSNTYVFCQVLVLARKGELLSRAYKCEVQECCSQIMRCKKVIEDLLDENEVRIRRLDGDVFDKTKKIEESRQL